jgi:hypothetical protein
MFNGDSLAAILLLHWLDGGGADKIYPAKYVRDREEVRDYLRSTARPVYLSQKPTPNGGIGGVVPRIKGIIKASPPYQMHLEGHVEASLSVKARAYMGLHVDNREMDALYALHGFLMITDVVAEVAANSPKKNSVKFTSWKCKASDEYHWDSSKHITVPNPDYNSTATDAVAPGEKSITVYHSNAIRVENAGLAKAFHDESEVWNETMDLTVIGPATVSF